MLDAELALRTINAYAGVLEGRLALARLQGTRREFEAVTDGQLRRAATACASATDIMDTILEGIDPAFASMAAGAADLACQRDFGRERPTGGRRLYLAVSDADPAA
ncbi:MAG TPA: hypothetical protein VN635_13195 [Conexibacter sp.]|nr:hypothetical protein [Conexibacter sp.]